MLKAVLAATLAAGLVSVSATHTALAKPQVRTTFKFYPVKGRTAAEIYTSMVSSGPNVDGMDAYASTNATSEQSGRLVKTGSCRVSDYSFRFDFTINLPKLRNEKALSSPTRAKWNSFQAFLRAHELQHTKIWLSCAADLERKVKALRASSCSTVDKEAGRLWKQMRNACEKRHQAFDAAEQRRVLKQPFVQAAFQHGGSNTSALTVPDEAQ